MLFKVIFNYHNSDEGIKLAKNDFNKVLSYVEKYDKLSLYDNNKTKLGKGKNKFVYSVKNSEFIVEFFIKIVGKDRPNKVDVNMAMFGIRKCVFYRAFTGD